MRIRQEDIEKGRIYRCSWNPDTIYSSYFEVLKKTKKIVKIRDVNTEEVKEMLLKLFVDWVVWDETERMREVMLMDKEGVVPTKLEKEKFSNG